MDDQRIEYWTLDKSDWLRGPWDDEPDKVQYRDKQTGFATAPAKEPLMDNDKLVERFEGMTQATTSIPGSISREVAKELNRRARASTWSVQGQSTAPDNLLEWLYADNRYPQSRGRSAALRLICELIAEKQAAALRSHAPK